MPVCKCATIFMALEEGNLHTRPDARVADEDARGRECQYGVFWGEPFQSTQDAHVCFVRLRRNGVAINTLVRRSEVLDVRKFNDSDDIGLIYQLFELKALARISDCHLGGCEGQNGREYGIRGAASEDFRHDHPLFRWRRWDHNACVRTVVDVVSQIVRLNLVSAAVTTPDGNQLGRKQVNGCTSGRADILWSWCGGWDSLKLRRSEFVQ